MNALHKAILDAILLNKWASPIAGKELSQGQGVHAMALPKHIVS